MIVAPGQSFTAVLDGAPSGLTGSLGVGIANAAGTYVVARTTAGITEVVSGSGVYTKTLTAPSTAGSYLILWDDGAASPTYSAEDLQVNTGLAVMRNAE